MASNDTLVAWGPLNGAPPSSNYATVDTRNGVPVLDFDASTEEATVFGGVLPRHYGGGGLTVTVHWMATSATSGDVVWGGSVERQNTDQDADSFATEQLSAAVTANGTSGIPTSSTIAHTSGANMDSLAAGEPFRYKLARKVANAGDTMTGDAEVVAVEIRET